MSSDPFSNPGKGFAGPRTEVRRSKDGRPYVYDADKGKEVLFTRCTTFIDVLEDKSVLARWGERMALLGIRDSVELGRELMSLMPAEADDLEGVEEEKRSLNDIIERAKEYAGAHHSRQMGTDLHGLTEMRDRGEDLPDVGDRLLADVEAYSDALRRYRLVPVEIEVFVVNDALRAAGTFDRVFQWYRDGWDAEPLHVIGDLKTGRVDYGQGKLAMQLALYANSKRYDPTDPPWRGELEVSTETGLVVHLPAGRAECKVYRADLDLGYEGLLLAQQVRAWRSRTRNGVLDDLDLSFDLENSLQT